MALSCKKINNNVKNVHFSSRIFLPIQWIRISESEMIFSDGNNSAATHLLYLLLGKFWLPLARKAATRSLGCTTGAHFLISSRRASNFSHFPPSPVFALYILIKNMTQTLCLTSEIQQTITRQPNTPVTVDES